MNKRIVLMSGIFFALLLGSASVWGHAALQGFTVTSTGPANGLFTTVGAQGAPNVQYTDVAWPVTVDVALLSTSPSNVVVNFPDRAWITLTRMRSQQRSSGGFIWTGRGGDCSAFLREALSSFKGQISCNNASYEVSAAPDGSGLQLVRAVATTGATHSDVATLPPGTSVQSQVQVAPAAQVDTSIEILVLYTAAVRVAMDGTGGGNVQTQLLAQDAVNQLQMALDNSTPGYPTSAPIATVTLVAAQEVLRTANGNFSADLTYLREDPEPVGMRNFWAADVVLYLTDNGGTGISGLANQPDYGGLPAPGSGYAQWALAALQYNCALAVIGPGLACYDDYVFPHEFAHTLGANHDTQYSPWPSPTYPPYPTSPPMPVEPYAFGHYGNVTGMNGGYRTIMAYSQTPSVCQAPCTRVPYFSNSQVTTPDGFKTGVANQQENARVLAEFAPATAQYRLSLGRIFYNGFEGVQ